MGVVGVGPTKWHVCGLGLDRSIHEGMNKCKGSLKDSQWKCKNCNDPKFSARKV